VKIYLDNSASTRVSPEAAKAVYTAMTEAYANPSAMHTAGQEAERLVKQARQQISFTLSAKPSNIIFTSGGTESVNLALFSVFDHMRQGGAILISAVEHPAVLEAARALEARGVRVDLVPVHGADTEWPGMVDTTEFRSRLTKDIRLISIMHVGNETGIIQPIGELSRIVGMYNSDNAAKIIFHSDAVQSYGKLAIDVSNGDFQDIDLVSISAHKIHGPKGAGALYAAAPEKLHPIIFGGGQEGGARSGTENVPAIYGFGVCARAANQDIVGHAKQANTCRRKLLDGIMAEIKDIRVNSPMDASVTGKAGCSSPYILNISFLGTRGEVLLHELEKSGIFVSTGAACASLGKDGPKASDTLAAIGLPKEAQEGALRFSFSWDSKPEEMDFVVDRLKNAVARFRSVGSYR